MILTIDVGNTNIVSGVFPEEKNNFDVIATFRVATNKSTTTDELGIVFKDLLFHNNIDAAKIQAGVYSSVVPPINHSISKMIFKYFNSDPLPITHEHFLKMPILYDDPASLGTDRLVNAYAAVNLYTAPLIIIDFGTATTFCAVSSKKEYLGGTIFPGISISLDALVSRTSKLPKVELGYPKKAIETETVCGMQSGIYYQTVDSVDGMVRRIKKEMNEEAPVTVVATGGLSQYIAKASEEIDIVEDYLSLKGLKYLYDEIRTGG